ncbi:MAG: hypothetical protein QNI86_06890 [Halieaceae bacterium]|nr:hypothetical protein [Halieaceae bacterium]
MRSVSQLAYLQALDIPTLVSRRNLPGAAPTQRLQLAPRAVPAAEKPEQAAGGAPAPELAAISAGLRQQADPQAAAPVAGTPVAGNPVAGTPVAGTPVAGTPVFSIAVTLAGGWFWIDEIPAGREPGDDYGQLLLAICRALGWPQEPARLERFNYPVAASLAGGVDEARQALEGFLTGRLTRLSPRGVIMMGDLDQPWFARQCLDGQRLVETVSAWQMLRDPGLKPRAWADLKALRGDV